MHLPHIRLLVLVSSLLSACGGGTPQPKGDNDAVEHPSSTPDQAGAAPTEAPAASAAAASDPAPKPSSTKASSTELVAPQGDDPWMAAHQMPASDVLKTMKGAMGRVNACWNAAKRRDPSVSGEVKIKFVITHEGGVRVWRDEDSTASDQEAVQCVGGVIKSLKFPTQKSPGDAWGVYAINFGG
jgi:hypothetical protein